MRTNRTYSVMAALTIAMTLCALPALAQIEINDIDELQLIGNDPGYPLDGDYILGNDIDASATAGWNSGAGFIPIAPDTDSGTSGYQGTPFTGSFDGAGYVITGLTINRSSTDYVGLFGYTNGATLQNVILENMDITGMGNVGGLVGINTDGSITTCYSTGTVTGDWYVGGLVGYNEGGSITTCYSTGTVLGNGSVGGLFGANIGSITTCYSTGAVSGNVLVGGLVGINDGSGSIEICYSTGAVSDGGGLVGYNDGSITDCYWDTETSGQSTSLGGTGKTTVEMMQQATFVDWDFAATWAICEGVTYPWLQSIPAPYPIIQPNVTVEQGASQNDPTGVSPIVFEVVFDAPVTDFDDGDLDFTGSTATIAGTTVTDSGDGMSYTIEITVSSEGAVIVSIPAGVLDICGLTTNLASTSTDNSVAFVTCIFDFEINDIDELQLIGNDPCYPLDADYVLGNDIDASATVGWNSGAGFAPIGNDTTPFTGTFDGAGYVITGLTINRPDTDYVGFFGYTHDGTLQNVVLENMDISGNNEVGGLVGSNGGNITNCYSTGAISGGYYVGGLVGNNGDSITNCYSTGAVSGGGNLVGGLVGINDGIITTCYSTGVVTGDIGVGGLVGYNFSGVITRCYSTGAVSGDGNLVGGLVGNNYDYGSITNCYSTGEVSGDYDIGGFAGNNSGSILHCYWDTETSGQSTSYGGTGKTTAEMMQQATFVDWDFAATWAICEGLSYPWLQDIPAPYPITQPNVTLEQGASQSDPTDEPLIIFEVVFDTPVTDFDEGDLDFTGSTAVITGATVTNTGDDMTYTVEVIPGSEGIITAAIPAGVIEICGIITNTASVSIDNTVTYSTVLAAPMSTWPTLLTLLAVGVIMTKRRKK